MYLSLHGKEGDAGGRKAGEDVVQGGEGGQGRGHYALTPALAPHVASRVLNKMRYLYKGQSHNADFVFLILSSVKLSA